jgi:hypothetical protein
VSICYFCVFLFPGFLILPTTFHFLNFILILPGTGMLTTSIFSNRPASEPSLQLLRSQQDRNAPPPPSHSRASTADNDTLSACLNRSRILRLTFSNSPTFNISPLPAGQSNNSPRCLSTRVPKQTRQPRAYSSFGLGISRSTTDPGTSPVLASLGRKASQ